MQKPSLPADPTETGSRLDWPVGFTLPTFALEGCKNAQGLSISLCEKFKILEKTNQLSYFESVFYFWIKCSLPDRKGHTRQTWSLEVYPRDIRCSFQKKIGQGLFGAKQPLQQKTCCSNIVFVFILLSKCLYLVDRNFVNQCFHNEALFCLFIFS